MELENNNSSNDVTNYSLSFLSSSPSINIYCNLTSIPSASSKHFVPDLGATFSIFNKKKNVASPNLFSVKIGDQLYTEKGDWYLSLNQKYRQSQFLFTVFLQKNVYFIPWLN